MYGFPTIEKVGTDQVLTSWLVLQHSTDCDWNKKLLLRYLDAYQKGEIKEGLLPYTFERFYDPKDGYCIKQNPEKAKQFIQLLKEKISRKVLLKHLGLRIIDTIIISTVIIEGIRAKK